MHIKEDESNIRCSKVLLPAPNYVISMFFEGVQKLQTNTINLDPKGEREAIEIIVLKT